MARLLTPLICSITEMRQPQKVFDRANGEPVAVLKNSRVIGYIVPQAFIEKHGFTDAEGLKSWARGQVADD